MAAEAVLKVKNAEEQGSELIKKSIEKAKEIVKQAGIDGVEKRKAIAGEALKTKEELVKTAISKAVLECSELTKDGEREKEDILNPDKVKLDRAVELVIERIVNLDGHS